MQSTQKYVKSYLVAYDRKTVEQIIKKIYY